MSAAATLAAVLSFDSSKYDEGLNDATKRAKSFSNDVSNALSNLSSRSQSLLGGVAGFIGDAFVTASKVAIAAIGAIGVAAVVLGTTAFLAAARVDELRVVNDVLGRNAGLASEEVRAEAEEVRSMGIEYAEAEGIVAQFIRSNIDLSKASDIARVAQDAAVISGLNSTEAATMITEAIVKLNPEMLRNAGIVVDGMKAYEDYADELGIAAEDMTSAQKQQALLNAVLKEGAKYAGVYEAAMQEPAKVLRSFPRYINDIMVSIGQGLKPAFGEAVMAVGDFLKGLGKAVSEGGALRPILDRITKGLEPLAKMFTNFVKGIDFNLIADRLYPIVDKVMTFITRLGRLVSTLGNGLFDFLLEGPDPENWGDLHDAIKSALTDLGVPPEFVDGLFRAGEIIVGIAETAGAVFGDLLAGDAGLAFDDLREGLLGIGVPQEVVDNITWLYEYVTGTLLPGLQTVFEWFKTEGLPAIQEFGTYFSEQLSPAFQAFGDWLVGNQGVIVGALAAIAVGLLGLGVAAGIALWGSGLAEGFLIIIALMAIVGAWAYLLYTAWTENWGGIQEKLTEVWTILEPILTVLCVWISTTLTIAIQTLADYWTNVLYPAIMFVWNWLSTVVFPFWAALADLFNAVVGKSIEALAGLWQNVLYPAIAAVYNYVADKVNPLLQLLTDLFNITLGPAIQGVSDTVIAPLAGTFDRVSSAIQGVIGWIGDLAEKIRNLELPSWLTPGSPTPFELGLRGIGSAMKDIGKNGLPEMSYGLSASAFAGVPGGGGNTTNYFQGATIPIGAGAPSNSRQVAKEALRQIEEMMRRQKNSGFFTDMEPG